MPSTSIHLDEAVDLTRTGDIWVFRGRTAADRAIQMTTNSPVNHVGMAVVIDDLPPLMWHAELGRSLPDLWAGAHHRGVQLHDLRDAVLVWGERYGQRAWLRQLDRPVTREMEDAVLRSIARLDGTPFPSTTRLASRWARGRLPAAPPWRRIRDRDQDRERGGGRMAAPEPDRRLETAFCAETVAATYQAMGLLPRDRKPSWYDPGRFWSGDDLALTGGLRLGGEISVRLPARANGDTAEPSRPTGRAGHPGHPGPAGPAGPRGCATRLREAVRRPAEGLGRLRNR